MDVWSKTVLVTAPAETRRRHDEGRNANAEMVGPVGMDPRNDASPLGGAELCPRRRHVVEEAAVLVVCEDQQRPRPLRRLDERPDDVRHEPLAVLQVRGGRVVGGKGDRRHVDEAGVNEDDGREFATFGDGFEIGAACVAVGRIERNDIGVVGPVLD